MMNKVTKTAVALGVGAGVWQGIKKLSKTGIRPAALAGILGLTTITAPAYAMSEQTVRSFASMMSAAANSQNIGSVSRLIDDNAVISLTRKNNTVTLDKNAYLQLLQKSWAGVSDYRYDITITDVVVTGNQARANLVMRESWIKDGKRIVFTTQSRATFSESSGNVVLLRAVSQATIEQLPN